MLDLLLPKPGEGIGSEIAVGKLYASILIQDCFRRFVLKQILVHFLHFFDLMYLLLISLKKIIVFLLKHTLEIYFVRHFFFIFTSFKSISQMDSTERST